MPEEVKEPSMSDLRAMLTASAAAPDAEETPAPAAAAAADGETAPAPEPESQQEHERDETGKFKGKEKAAEPAKEPEDTPGVKKRIGKLLEDKRRAEQRAQELEAQLAKGSQPAADKPAETAKPAATERPQAKNFDTYEAYVDALTDWKIDSRKAAEAKADGDRKAAEAQTATLTAWQDRVAKTRETHADFDEVLDGAKTLPISQAMHNTILEMERGPEVAYALAQQPDEAKRIAKLGPLAAAAALGRIEAGLASSKAAPAKPAATAAKPLPKPPAKVGGATPAAIDLNDENLSPAVFAREFKKRLATERS